MPVVLELVISDELSVHAFSPGSQFGILHSARRHPIPYSIAVLNMPGIGAYVHNRVDIADDIKILKIIRLWKSTKW